MNRWRWIGLAVVVVVVVAGLWLRSRGQSEEPKYRTAAVERGAIETVVSATGTVRPVVQVLVGSQVSGTVNKLMTDYNARVKAGDVLCQIEPSAFRARELQAEASVARAQAALNDGQRQLRRTSELVKDDYVSQADVEAAQVAVEQREADLKQARAQLEAAQVDLANTTIHAPIDGVVISRSIDVGQTVAASLQAPQLFVIANDLSQMQVETRIDEADIGRISTGLPVTFTVDAFPDLSFEGRVAQVRLEPIVEQGVVTYTTVIHTRNDDLKLRPGMTANVSVLVQKKDDVLKVPNAALRFHPAVNGGARAGARASGGTGGAGAFARDGASTAAGMPGAGAGGSRARAGAGIGSAADAGTPAGAGPRGGAWGQGGGGAPSRDEIVSRMKARGMSDEQIAQAMAKWRESHGSGAPGEGGGASTARGAGGRGAAPGGAGVTPGTADPETVMKPGAIYVLRDGRPIRVAVMTGISDGAAVEIASDALKPGDLVVVGMETAASKTALQPPPGLGGPGFGGGRGGRGGGR